MGGGGAENTVITPKSEGWGKWGGEVALKTQGLLQSQWLVGRLTSEKQITVFIVPSSRLYSHCLYVTVIL